MMDRKILLVGLFALVLAVAGCTAPGQSTDEDDSNNAELEITQNDGLSVTFSSQADGDYYAAVDDPCFRRTLVGLKQHFAAGLGAWRRVSDEPL